ncbi:MAG: DUF3095 family protein [Bacteroidota bacterium]|nr:DUF3095 family protein [Bacteroidota bacterium]
MADVDFYKNLYVYYDAVHDVLADESLFEIVPESWHIIVTDVQNSSAAVAAGKHQLVNLAATGCIVACLNISREREISIPFFFGGDGATIMVPEPLLDECLHALVLHQQNCKDNFDFFLRVDSRPLKELYNQGAVLKITKVRLNELHVSPIVLGDALQIAETSIKKDNREIQLSSFPFNLNLNGMECKWDKIEPPQTNNEILTLIINATKTEWQSEIYSNVLRLLDEIYGEYGMRHPIIPERLNMVDNLKQLKDEVLMKFSSMSWLEMTKSIMRILIGKFYLRNSKEGQRYLNELSLHTESLMIDGSINTVITGSSIQREKLLKKLEQLKESGQITFGYHVSNRSVLSCFVTALDDYHVHFVDGDQGGYTKAAQIFKSKKPN